MLDFDNLCSTTNDNLNTYTSRFLLTGYVGLILRSTAVATARRGTVEGTMRVLESAATSCSSLSAFCQSSVRVSHSTLNGTAT